jgi:hypothetical protein
MTRQALLFVLVTAICVVGAAGYVAWAALNPEDTRTDAAVKAVAEAPADVATQTAGPSADVAPAPSGRLMVRALDPENPQLDGDVTIAPLRHGARPRAVPEQACQRVYYAGGRGLCLALSGQGVEYEARIFDERMKTVHELPVEGIPSRARVSRDGRVGSFTTFVTGHSYAASGAFSTRTMLVDLESGEEIANLERFRVIKDGRTFDAPDFNFWGVTFAEDSSRFFATLASGDHHYLVEGDIPSRTVRIRSDGVECPSLSPDGTRIAFKSRIGQDQWRLEVLDLNSGARVLLGEPRSVDDQPEWLDGGWIAYGRDGDVWAVRSDGKGRPRRLLADAESPAALRGSSG